MPLQKQLVTIPFTGGVDTKTDKYQVQMGNLLVLENGTFEHPSEITKRNGVEALPVSVGPNSSLTVFKGAGLATFNTTELITADGTSLYSLDVANQCQPYKGQFTSVSVTQAPVIRNTYQQTAQDGTTHPNGVQVYAWEDSSGGCLYRVVDSTTGQTTFSGVISATGIKPKVLSLGTQIVIVYYDTTAHKLFAATLAAANPGAGLTSNAITGSSGDTAINTTTPSFDAALIEGVAGRAIYVAFNTANTSITIFQFTGINIVNPAFGVTLSGETASVIGLCNTARTTDPVVVGYWNGTKVRFGAYSTQDLSQLAAPTDVETISNIVSISGVSINEGVSIELFYTVSASNTWDYSIRQAVIALYSVNETLTAFRSVGLAGKTVVRGPFPTSNGGDQFYVYMPMAHESPLQSTYFLSGGGLIAKFVPGNGGGIPRPPSGGSNYGGCILPETTTVDSDTLRFSFLIKDEVTSANGGLYAQTGVISDTVSFSAPVDTYLHGELGNGLHWNGGFLWLYDGTSITEHGFHLFPENLSLTNPNNSENQWQYCAVYAWQDAQGNVERSNASVPVTYASSTAPGSGNHVALTIPTLRLTAKSGVWIEVYRTTMNGQNFYRLYTNVGDLNSPTNPVLNDPTTNTVTFTDTVDGSSTSTLAGNQILYTTGVLENIEPPAVSAMTVHVSRLFVVPSDAKNSIWYSKQVVPGSPVEFNDSLVVNCPGVGSITALADMDDKLLIGKADRWFYMTGVGPDDAGNNNDFVDPVIATLDCGCINPRAVANTPAGVIFQSAKGIYLLSRGLQTQYIGAPVEGILANQTITSTQLKSDSTQIIFTLSGGGAITYDYYVGQWGSLPPINAIDSVIWQGRFTYLTSTGQAYQETPGTFIDPNNQPISLKLQTPWIAVAGLQGVQRVWRILILGKYKSDHKLKVSIATNYNDVDTQVAYAEPEAPSTYGSNPAFGVRSPNTYGGESGVYQWVVYPQEQRCESLRLTIEDELATPGEGYSISAIALEVGVVPGQGWKLRAGRSVS
jgi:hypothetical protein